MGFKKYKVVIEIDKDTFMKAGKVSFEFQEQVGVGMKDAELELPEVKKIRKVIKKLELPTIKHIRDYTGYGLPKLRRLLDKYDAVYWKSSVHQGQGRMTKKYKNVKEKK